MRLLNKNNTQVEKNVNNDEIVNKTDLFTFISSRKLLLRDW